MPECPDNLTFYVAVGEDGEYEVVEGDQMEEVLKGEAFDWACAIYAVDAVVTTAELEFHIPRGEAVTP